jgi:hypothetical protein
MPRPDFAAQERLLHEMDRESRERTERVKDMVREAGRPELADELDEKMRLIENGVQNARSTWHSISDAQRALLGHVVERTGNMRLVISDRGALTYAVEPPGVPLPKPARLSTVRALASRGLLDWDGGAFKPEWAAVANEKAKFVLKHGRPPVGEAFTGFRP